MSSLAAVTDATFREAIASGVVLVVLKDGQAMVKQGGSHSYERILRLLEPFVD